MQKCKLFVKEDSRIVCFNMVNRKSVHILLGKKE